MTLPPGYALRRVPWKRADRGDVRDVDCACFPQDVSFWNERGRTWWIVLRRGRVVAYAGAYVRVVKGVRTLVLVRAGVLRAHRRMGLHRALLEARVRHARRMDCARVSTYVSRENLQSRASLSAAGFVPFRWDRSWIHYEMRLRRGRGRK